MRTPAIHFAEPRSAWRVGLVSSLAELLKQARGYAEFAMRRFGNVAPMMIGVTPKGPIHFAPSSLENEKAKDDFANTARLVVTGYGATAAVMILESWMTLAGPDGELPKMRPSESPDRREIVMLAAESFGEHQTEILPIVRSDSGKFFGFGEPDTHKLEQMQGRFAKLMPPEPVDDEMSLLARTLLQAMGIKARNLKPRFGRN